MQITALGKEIRKRRIDAGMNLGQMAQALSLSPAYLSAIETGKRAVPTGFVEAVGTALALSGDDTTHLHRLADRERREFRVEAKNSGLEARELAGLFARQFSALTGEQLAGLRSLLEKEI